MNKLIFWIIAVVIVGAGVWYVWPASKIVAPIVTPVATPTPTPKPGASHAPVPTPTPTILIVPTSTPASTPSTSSEPVSSPQATPSESPGLIVQEVHSYTVTIQNNSFTPATLTVHQGDIVVFQNMDSLTQTATSLNRVFDSKNIQPGYQWTLQTANLAPGTYDYNSTLHPVARGTLIIQ